MTIITTDTSDGTTGQITILKILEVLRAKYLDLYNTISSTPENEEIEVSLVTAYQAIGHAIDELEVVYRHLNICHRAGLVREIN